MNVKKQDRQWVRTPADLERKYELNLIGKSGGGGGASGDLSSLKADLDSLTTYTYERLGELESGKANQSGWTPNKYLGTNKDGNIEEKDAPASEGGDYTLTDEDVAMIVEAVIDALPDGDEVSY